jgi:hypothetical protein
MPDNYYSDKLYPFQDEVLGAIQSLKSGFYLTGGTALGRCYLNHRYSDDLDFFVNAAPDFKEQFKMVLSCLEKMPFTVRVSISEESFVRLFLEKNDIILKIDFVNDVSFHAGPVEMKNGFGRVDSWRNILSNKICAMSRMEPKDYADILYTADIYDFQWQEIIGEAREKDLWVDPLEVSRMIHQFPVEHLKAIKWTGSPPSPEISRKAVTMIAEDILNGRENRMKHLFKNSPDGQQ